MNRKFIVNPILCAFCAVISIFSATMIYIMIIIERFGSAAIFGVMAVVFLCTAVYFGNVISVDHNGIRKYVLGIPLKHILWSEIEEIGICGTKVFNKGNPKKVGTIYIYFSTRKLDENAHFKMILEWPPKDMYFVLYNQARLTAIQTLWSSRIETYNVGGLSFGEGLKN